MGAGSRINGQLIALIGFILVCLTLTFVVTALLPRLVPKEKNCEDHDVVRSENLLVLGAPSGGKLRIRLNTGNTTKRPGKYYYCAAKNEYIRPQAKNITCKEYQWRLNRFVPSITDCFELDGQSWFGGSTLWRQEWPLNTVIMNRSAYVPGDVYQRQYGGVMERYWISTGGFSVFVSDRVPLYVEMKDSRLCLAGSLESGVYNLTARFANESLLAYTVCSGPDIRSLYRSTKFWESPSDTPDMDLFNRPIWSTWAYLKSNISEEKVIEFAKQINARGLPVSQLEIDDKWSTNYGDHAFDADRFPNATGMVNSLHALGYNVTLWAHPFVNRDTESFAVGLNSTRHGGSFLVSQGANATEPAMTGWWRGAEGTSALVDVTDQQGEGTRYLEKRLQSLREVNGVDSFKLDGGETNWLPTGARLRGYPQDLNPGWYSHAWAQLGSRIDSQRGRRLEVRVGFRAQPLPLLVRAMDKDSNWGLDNGLKSMVTSALTQCLIGYNFHLPDMVGGNAYCSGPDGLDGLCYPDRELYIRWLQAAVFMPTVQLSVPPWVYDQEAVNITKTLLAIRSEARFQQNMKDALAALKSSGDPLLRPMWWLQGGPNGDKADQFLLGDSVLVAPVLEKGASKRQVVFPQGRWRPWFATDDSGDVTGPREASIEVPFNSVGAFWLVK